MKNKSLIIKGMTCASCAKAVERHVGKVTGVNSANVNLATEKLNVEYDEALTDISNIYEAIRNAGYDVEEATESNIRK